MTTKRHHRQLRRLTAAVPLLAAVGMTLAALTGCAEMLPSESLVINTRILAIKVEVTVPLFPDEPGAKPRAQGQPLEQVTLTPFVVGPEGPVDPAQIDPVWIACQLPPSAGLFSCISDSFPIALDDIPACPVQTMEDLLNLGDELPEVPSPCLIGREGAPNYTIPLSGGVFSGGDIEITMIGQTPGGTSTDACARDLLSGDYEIPGDCILALQRLTIGPLEALILQLDMFGVDLGFPLPDPDEIPDADRHPEITRFDVTIVDEDGEPTGDVFTLDPSDPAGNPPVEAKLGQTLMITTTAPEEDLQEYPIQVSGSDPETETEAYSGDWFRTWGSLLSGTSDDPESRNEWRLVPDPQDEDEAPPDGRATMFYVLRDGRRGLDWFWFDVEVSE